MACSEHNRRADREEAAEENRRRFPEVAAWVDRVREHFPGAVVISVRPMRSGCDPDDSTWGNE